MNVPRGPRPGGGSFGRGGAPRREQERGSRGPGGPAPRPGGGSGGAAGGGWLPLPAATVEALRAAGGVGRCSNLSLALNRFVDVWSHGGRQSPDAVARDKLRETAYLRACTGIVSNVQARELLGQYQARHEALLESYRRVGWRCELVRGRLTRRLAIGLGIAHPLETNLALHRIGGFPYLPGSTVKGAVRAAAEALEGIDSPAVRAAFGPASGEDAHGRGALVFLDALPEPGVQLAVDVMTPHHSDYYTGSEPPADWQSPVPILFPCVERGSVFRFAVACQPPTADGADMSGLDRRMDWLREALRDGLGGKRSAGYGTFEVIA